MCLKSSSAKSLTKVQKRQFIEKMLNEDFPLVPIALIIVFELILALASIAFQVVTIIYETSSFYFVGCGIWVGAFVILTNIISITLVAKRTYCLFIMSLVFHLLSFLVPYPLVVLSTLTIRYDCIACNDLFWFNYALLGIGVLLILLSFAFIISFAIKSLRYLRNFLVESYYIRN